jgi:hypothetical protein
MDIEYCSKQTGYKPRETLPIYKQNNVDSYNKLNRHFD